MRCPFGEFKPPGASARSRGELGDGGEVFSYPLSPTIGGGALVPCEMTFCGEGDRRRLVRGSSTEGCDEGRSPSPLFSSLECTDPRIARLVRMGGIPWRELRHGWGHFPPKLRERGGTLAPC